MDVGRFVAVCALTLVSCGPAIRDVEEVGRPILYDGRVVTSRGPTMARAGDECLVEIRRTDDAYLNCRIRIRCSGDLVYGLSGAGFNNCRQEGDRFVSADDHAGTRRDGDPRMFLDIEAGRVVIRDDDPDIEVLVDLVAHPEGYERNRPAPPE